MKTAKSYGILIIIITQYQHASSWLHRAIVVIIPSFISRNHQNNIYNSQSFTIQINQYPNQQLYVVSKLPDKCLLGNVVFT